MAQSYQIWLFENIADGSRYKFWGIVALFVWFGTIFMMKAKQDKMKYYNTSYENTYIYMEGKSKQLTF